MEVSGRREGEEDEQENRENERECEACKGEGVTTKADGVCIECEELMCKKCFAHHLKAKQCRNHMFNTSFPNIAPLKRNIEVEKCKRHFGELIKFYCRKHETVGCGECMIPEHGGCSPENIKDLCKEFRYSEEFAGLERSFQDVECSAKANSTKINENKTANADMFGKALNDIRQFRKDINTFLENAETTIIQEAKEVSDANDARLTRLENDCMIQSTKIAEMSGQLDPDLYSESGLFIQTVTLKSIILDLQQAMSRLQEENNIKEFNFALGKQLQSLTKSLHNFGKMCCSSSQPSTVSKEEKPKLLEKTPNTQTEDKMQLYADYDNENRDCCVNTQIVVGSRVRIRNSVHRLNGTVTQVGTNGNVTVQWDWGRRTKMANIKDIQLI